MMFITENLLFSPLLNTKQ